MQNSDHPVTLSFEAHPGIREVVLDCIHKIDDFDRLLEIKERPITRAQSGLDIYLSNPIILYLGSAFFAITTAEIIKDLYKQIKRISIDIIKSAKIYRYNRNGEISDKYLYYYSIYMFKEEGRFFKLVFEKDLSEDEIEKTISLAVNFVEKYHKTNPKQKFDSDNSDEIWISRTTILSYSKEKDTIIEISAANDNL